MSREIKDTKNYVSILSADGTFRLTVPEGTPGAVKRDWTVGDKSGTKNELVYKSLSGKITNVAVVETDIGRLLQVTITDEQGDLTISTPTSNNFATDFMKKLPNINKEKEVKLAPFSFTNEKEKLVKGITITQDDVKVENFYKDNANGIPVPEEGKTYTKNKWKSYFGEVEDFLVATIKSAPEDLAKDF